MGCKVGALLASVSISNALGRPKRATEMRTISEQNLYWALRALNTDQGIGSERSRRPMAHSRWVLADCGRSSVLVLRSALSVSNARVGSWSSPILWLCFSSILDGSVTVL